MKQVFHSDTELLEGLARGDSHAVEALYRLYHPILKKWMIARGALADDVEDIFQETAIIVYEKARSPEFCLTCKLGTYLFAISKRLWFKKLQQNRLNDTFDELTENEISAEDEDVSRHLEKETHLEQLEQAIDKLGSPCRELIRAFYIEQKSMRDIADLFNYTNPDNAKTQKYKCLNRLRKLFFAEKKLA